MYAVPSVKPTIPTRRATSTGPSGRSVACLVALLIVFLSFVPCRGSRVRPQSGDPDDWMVRSTSGDAIGLPAGNGDLGASICEALPLRPPYSVWSDPRRDTCLGPLARIDS